MPRRPLVIRQKLNHDSRYKDPVVGRFLNILFRDSHILFLKLCITVGIRIVADCVALSWQDTRKLKRATTPYFITELLLFLYIIINFFSSI